jgi:hypothetical protein
MTPENHQWHIHLIKDRYFHLNNLTLNDEQAAHIYQYEEDKDIHSDKHFFSDWEGWDFELSTFRNILEADQLKIYEGDLQKRISQYTAALIEADASKLNEIKYQEELISFYEEQFLPEIRKELHLLTISFREHQTKIDFLKAEYSKFLAHLKKETLIIHFRYNKTYKPNELKASLLKHQLRYIWPYYAYFKAQADEATKAVATFLENQFHYFPKKLEEVLHQQYEVRRQFVEPSFKKLHDPSKGWVFVSENKTSPEEESKHNMMCLLLL